MLKERTKPINERAVMVGMENSHTERENIHVKIYNSQIMKNKKAGLQAIYRTPERELNVHKADKYMGPYHKYHRKVSFYNSEFDGLYGSAIKSAHAFDRLDRSLSEKRYE